MKIKCKNCAPLEGIDIPDFTESDKKYLQDLKLKSPLHTVKYLIDNYRTNHRDAKFIVTHINTNYGHCNRCVFENLDAEYKECPKCGALNFNWKINNTQNEIMAWLEVAFVEPVDRINETYYFDRRDHQFFSIFITDYFLTDPDNPEENINSPYSKDQLAVLAERIDCVENNSDHIQSIPRLTIEERKEMMELFIISESLSSRTDLTNLITAENGRSNLDFGGNLLPDEKENWRLFKSHYCKERIDSFCHLNNIDLSSASLWTTQKTTSMSLNLKDNNIES